MFVTQKKVDGSSYTNLLKWTGQDNSIDLENEESLEIISDDLSMLLSDRRNECIHSRLNLSTWMIKLNWECYVVWRPRFNFSVPRFSDT